MSEIIQDEKKRKKTLLITILLVALITGIVVGYIYTAQRKYTPPPPKPKIELKGKSDDTAKESWIAQSATQIQEQQKKIDELQKALKALEQKKEEASQLPSLPQYVPPPPTTSTTIAPPPSGGIGQQAQRQKTIMSDLIVISGSRKTEPSEPEKEGQPITTAQRPQQSSGKAGLHMPAGSFVKAVLLSGVDAPGGAKGKGSPYPTLLRVSDMAQLPNEWRGDIKECFIVGEAYGELASERAQIRVNTLSCVNKQGDVIEGKLTGYVVGEDGKVGLSGRVVTKQGAILARALITGFLQGVSQAFSQSATVLNVTPSGNVTTIDPSKTMQAAVGGGMSKATEELAKFYMELAREMFPVVEINAGRKVEVVFVQGVTLSKTGGIS